MERTPSNSSARVMTKRSILIMSSCPVEWGGSEELWCETALALKKRGHAVSAVKSRVNFKHRRIQDLQAAGVPVEDYLWNRVPRTSRILRRMLPYKWLPPQHDQRTEWLKGRIRRSNPDLTLISQADNFDGIHFAAICQDAGVPYVLLSEKASDTIWPPHFLLDPVRTAYGGALRAYFVSQHNLNHTELQLGERMKHAQVVRNPLKTPISQALPWPKDDGICRIANVGRLYATEKGQDILIRVLAQDKWRKRPLEISFFGAGDHLKLLQGMAHLLEVYNVRFVGFTDDIADIWRTHHALAMPSRAEGLPLALVEAMYCGRPAIVTDVGGNAEVVDEGITGFISGSPSIAEFDNALEKAWARRGDWLTMGLEAARRIRTMVQPDAGEQFASILEDVCDRESTTK